MTKHDDLSVAIETIKRQSKCSSFKLLHGDSYHHLCSLDSNCVDSLVTDPPAGIAFMGNSWDKLDRNEFLISMQEVFVECLRVMKPGAHGLVWAIPRTSHWTATALEDAGFEIRDVVTHLFGSGFPKSMNVSIAIDKAAGAKPTQGPMKRGGERLARLVDGKRNGEGTWGDEVGRNPFTSIPTTDDAKQWDGWGTALKPASEHWILVRKPCSEKTVAANVLKWGTGALNIDASRILTAGELIHTPQSDPAKRRGVVGSDLGISKATSSKMQAAQAASIERANTRGRFPANLVLDEEAAVMLDKQSGMEASRFFYCAKPAKSEKNAGADNHHPTVKPVALMSYFCKMITPPGGLVLDPFVGSGTTGVAAVKHGFQFIGIDQDESYIKIAAKRIEAAA